MVIDATTHYRFLQTSIHWLVFSINNLEKSIRMMCLLLRFTLHFGRNHLKTWNVFPFISCPFPPYFGDAWRFGPRHCKVQLLGLHAQLPIRDNVRSLQYYAIGMESSAWISGCFTNLSFWKFLLKFPEFSSQWFVVFFGKFNNLRIFWQRFQEIFVPFLPVSKFSIFWLK